MGFASESPAHWESTYLESAEHVIELAEEFGLSAGEREPFDSPWKGVHVRLLARKHPPLGSARAAGPRDSQVDRIARGDRR